MKFRCCYKCADRYPACWGSCQKYLAEKRANDEEKGRRRDQRQKEHDFKEVIAKRGKRR